MRKIVIQDHPKTSRRSFLKLSTSLLVTAMASTPFYSFFLERFWIEEKHINLSFNRLPDAFSGLKIVHISDLHIGDFYGKDHVADIVKRVNQLKPDILCFTGDLVEDNVDMLDEITPILKKIRTNLAKIAILGNHDYRAGAEKKVQLCLRNSGFIVLNNENISFARNGFKIHIAGIEDMMFGNPSIEKSIANIPEDHFIIMLAHEPDFADTVSQYPIDLQLSGHSHGGQILIPFIGPIFKPDGAKNYLKGLQKVSNTMLYTSRGIGTTFLPIRFNCRPEITVFTLKHSEQK